MNKAQKFILDGAKLKITVMFRGREMARKEAGIELLKRVTDILDDVAKIDKDASMELISEIHTELREADALKVNYSSKSKAPQS